MPALANRFIVLPVEEAPDLERNMVNATLRVIGVTLSSFLTPVLAAQTGLSTAVQTHPLLRKLLRPAPSAPTAAADSASLTLALCRMDTDRLTLLCRASDGRILDNERLNLRRAQLDHPAGAWLLKEEVTAPETPPANAELYVSPVAQTRYAVAVGLRPRHPVAHAA